MQVKTILQQKGGGVVTIRVGQTVHDAIRTLNEHGIGALIVVEANGRISGIVTERDILYECGERCAHLTQGEDERRPSCPALVDDIMTRDVIIGLPDDELSYVMGVMTKNKIRHLPILDEGGLVGIISIGDVVNAHVKEADFENRMLREYVQGAPEQA